MVSEDNSMLKMALDTVKAPPKDTSEHRLLFSAAKRPYLVPNHGLHMLKTRGISHHILYTSHVLNTLYQSSQRYDVWATTPLFTAAEALGAVPESLHFIYFIYLTAANCGKQAQNASSHWILVCLGPPDSVFPAWQSSQVLS